jgi:hypothetical protein
MQYSKFIALINGENPHLYFCIAIKLCKNWY